MANPKKKQFGEARADYGKEQEGQPFGNYDDDVFAALDAGQVEADTLPIMSIWADKTQPRNIIPREVHGGWTGSPSAMPDILGAWIEAIYDTGIDLPIEDILSGKNRGSDKTNSLSSDEPLVQKFLPIMNLAAQIRDMGLKQRIGVIAVGKEYRIIYGERRWTAFHLLKMMLGDGYASIPAQVAKVSEWELAKIQAAENFHQHPLNAIGKARQLAKLLILARKDSQDAAYDSWEALVVEGGCNRPYFAQVSDGDKHRIPKGMGEEFERTLNISVEQMRQYRGLLRLTGDYEIDNKLWDMGDERDWAEQFMRQIPQYLEVPIIRQILRESQEPEEMLREAIAVAKQAKAAEKKAQDTVTVVTVSEDPTPEEAAPKSPFGSAIGVSTGMGSASKLSFKFGDEVMTPDGAGRIIQTVGNTHLVKLDSGLSRRYGDVQLQPAAQGDSWFNKYVQNISGRVGVVIVDFGGSCEVEYADGSRSTMDKPYLSEVDKIDWGEEVQRHRALQPPPNLMNFVGKVVQTFQGVGKVSRNHDAQTVEVQFPDGDTLIIAKKDLSVTDSSRWDEAVAALNQAPAKPVLKFKVDDRVLVRVGMNQAKGTIRYIQEDAKKPYGVFLEETKSTHYYEEWQLSTYEYWQVDEKRGSDNANSLPPEPKDILGIWASHKVHGEGRIASIDGETVNFIPNGQRTAIPLPQADFSQTSETKPREWVGKPALWNEGKGYKVPVFVQEFIGAGMLKVASSAGQQHEVHFSQLEPVATGDTRLSDFMNGDDPDHDHSDLINKRVRLQNGEIGTITAVDTKRISLQFSQFVTGSALIEHIVEVLGDDAAEETKAITDVDTQALLRHIGHLTGRENTVLKLINLTRQNAIDAYKAQQLVPDLQLIRDSIKSGFSDLIAEVESILETIVTEAEEAANN